MEIRSSLNKLLSSLLSHFSGRNLRLRILIRTHGIAKSSTCLIFSGHGYADADTNTWSSGLKHKFMNILRIAFVPVEIVTFLVI